MLTINLPKDIESRLEDLAKFTGKTKESLVEELITVHLIDLADIYLAEKRLQVFRDGKSRAVPIEEVENRLELTDSKCTDVKWTYKHTHLLMKLSAAIDLLPNVKPRRAMWLLDEINDYFFHEYLENGYSEDAVYRKYEMNGLSITLLEFKSMVVSAPTSWGDDVNYITPDGADLLVRMYRNGCFELKKKSDFLGDTRTLEKYAASGEELLRRYAQSKELSDQQKAQEDRWKEHPEELPEEEFTPSRLNDIMWHHGVKGMHVSMEIGGIIVTKTVSRHNSNSGKSHENTVVFKWIGSDGVDYEKFQKKSSFENNRRNDAGRNWGLQG